jgi:hypothetical protein
MWEINKKEILNFNKVSFDIFKNKIKDFQNKKI